MSLYCVFLYLSLLCLLYLCVVSCLHLPNSDPLTQIPNESHYRQSSTNKNFSLTLPFFFPLSLVFCPTATPLFPIPYYYVQLPVNKGKNHLTITTISTLSIYLFYLYNARVTNTESQCQKTKKRKRKKETQTVQFSRSTSTKSPNQFS